MAKPVLPDFETSYARLQFLNCCQKSDETNPTLEAGKGPKLEPYASICFDYSIKALPMKSLRCLILVVLATTFTCEYVFADGPDDRGFGRGRVLRRLRNDLFGASKQPTQPRKTPTPANAQNKVPTPAGNKKENPYAAARYRKDGQSASKVPTAQQRDPRRPPGLTPRPTDAARSATSPQDFGMMIAKNNDDQFVVTRVTPGGNAASSGVRPGDLVVEVGGAPLTNIEEFNSIADVMGQGDQLEFKFQTRGGKPRTIHVQYGTTPEVDSENEALNSDVETTQYQNGLRSVLDKTTIQANYRSTVNRSDQTPLPPKVRRATDRGAVHTISDRQYEVLQKDKQTWRPQTRPQSISQQDNGPSLNGPGN